MIGDESSSLISIGSDASGRICVDSWSVVVVDSCSVVVVSVEIGMVVELDFI